MISIAVPFCAFVVLTNLSLAHNAIGTYQMAKMLSTPCIIVTQMILYKKHFSTFVKLSLIPISFGVIVNFYYDAQFSISGTIYATMGVLITSLYQIWLNGKQRELQMDPMQLLYYQAPLSAIMLFIIVPFFEPIGNTLTHKWSLLDIFVILLSSIVAFFVNLTSYWTIGYTSPLTYNTIGHFKFCLLLLGGCIIFNESLMMYQVIGIILTLIGVILHAHVKMNHKESALPESTVEEGKPFHET